MVDHHHQRFVICTTRAKLRNLKVRNLFNVARRKNLMHGMCVGRKTQTTEQLALTRELGRSFSWPNPPTSIEKEGALHRCAEKQGHTEEPSDWEGTVNI